ncbi:Zinc transporter ZitB [Candidatus Methanobinarius endosymbioticus]|uniref:Zinc transporter ZitB n=1 Tax=Candidatus Methanobinarius endosymbioticus TaxID=2006182 RepID=A0A366M8H6_9EURY|nr:Zinc transporter ZitB [Candidatus Methanobinarius endosymbioticus]
MKDNDSEMKNIRSTTDNSHMHDFEYHKAAENISFAFFLNIIFMVVVGIGAVFTNSMAILADLLHGLSDTFALGFSWFFQKFSEKEEDDKFTYGYRRFSLLGAVVTSSIVIVGSVLILIESFSRLFAPVELHASGMVVVAIFAIILKVLSVWKMRGSKTLNEKVVSIHLIGDLMGWIALLIVGAILIFVNIPTLDVLLSIVITIWMIYNLVKTLFYSFKILLLQAPSNIDQNKLKRDIVSIEGIDDIVKFYLWSLDNQKNVLTVKIDLDADLKVSDTEKIKESVNELGSLNGIEDINIEFSKK